MRTAATSPSSFLTIVLAMAVVSACSEPTMSVPHAEAHWAQCSPCHGERGEGNIVQLAPGIAGLPVWYVDAQLMKFRTGARGSHFDDVAGLRMKPMAMALRKDANVKEMAAYVAQLPHAPTVGTIAGDVAAGKTLFATCAACHGADGGGNEMMNAPPISGRDDWYIYAQLKKFKLGIRGTNAKDSTGPAMRAIAMSLADDKAMQDVARFVSELPAVVATRPVVVVDKTVPADVDAAMKAVAAETGK